MKIEKLKPLTKMDDYFKSNREANDKINELVDLVNLQQEQIQRLREFIHGGVK